MKLEKGRGIDYDAIIHNVEMMINTLEYDSMRSAGKCKINAGTLNELYLFVKNLEERKPKKTTAAKKKEG